ncbi:SigE family RNA polymerase sigma factor [Bailinhaonella thermotolerans]|uniref:SigE family RNA polymerase sigma factor n=1 Tax=Bailinhaonella thermotolerans TaxID=1070861 RepID=A0A3A4AWJ1_9ACTN|nr:SigE family RNA polymerase sigma factor [Bailinhaonella thermotolerans]RJL33243.1 SigE family RNA polymerase sigma factor [Bailinhaonella thermotolerans]
MSPDDERDYVAYVTARLPSLRRLAYNLCRDEHRADDLVQNTITRLYVHWTRSREANDLHRYVDKMLVRCFLNDQRLGWWTRVRLTARPAELPVAGADLETRAVVQAALALVPPRQRAVLVLRFLCDLPVTEIAELLGCSEGNVKSQTARGLARLRELLGRGANRLEEEEVARYGSR